MNPGAVGVPFVVPYPGLRLEVQKKPPAALAAVKPSKTCKTSDDRAGNCTSYKECYPLFKTFSLSEEDSWVMGSFDSCSLETPSGKIVSPSFEK